MCIFCEVTNNPEKYDNNVRLLAAIGKITAFVVTEMLPQDFSDIVDDRHKGKHLEVTLPMPDKLAGLFQAASDVLNLPLNHVIMGFVHGMFMQGIVETAKKYKNGKLSEELAAMAGLNLADFEENHYAKAENAETFQASSNKLSTLDPKLASLLGDLLGKKKTIH